jgi:putative FmdB family regulatory protein
MPIYAYRCAACGHAQDVLQKISDPLLTICPACGAEAYAKQVTAAGFQLKGSGWYVTDFRSNGTAPKDGKKAESAQEAPKSEGESKPASSDAAAAPAATSAAQPATAPAAASAAPAAAPPASGA